MEVLNDCAAYLSNYEVLDILKSIKSSKKQKGQNQLATITYQTIKYLEDTPCTKQTPEKIDAFLKALEPFKLTKGEKLTLLNQCPKTDIEIQLIVEESEERLTEEAVQSLLQIVEESEERLSEEAVLSLLQVIADHLGPEEEQGI